MQKRKSYALIQGCKSCGDAGAQMLCGHARTQSYALIQGCKSCGDAGAQMLCGDARTQELCADAGTQEVCGDAGMQDLLECLTSYSGTMEPAVNGSPHSSQARSWSIHLGVCACLLGKTTRPTAAASPR